MPVHTRLSISVDPTTRTAIRQAIYAGLVARDYKGDLQDRVWRAVGRDLTMVEAAFCTEVLRTTGYEAPPGFARDQTT